MPFEVGQLVTDYEILGVLGKGGMGAVYRVRNVISNRIEAMKVLLADVGAQADVSDRFISEIRTLARLEHPNIAKFHTAFKAENQLVMVMEFVEGFTFSDFAHQGPIPIEQVLSYVSQTLSALICAHANGVVHRDIKPSNVMVTPHGVVKLMDFGIAKSSMDPSLTRTGTTIGSMLYMSPEQVRGENVDARSDLYSLGIVLYELTAGKRPFEADNTFAILDAHLNVPPRPPIDINPQLPHALNEIILLAIEKDPSRRFQTAVAFRAALESVRQHLNSAPAQPAKSGSEKDQIATVPSAVPFAQTIVEPGLSANPAPAPSRQYAHTIVEPGLGTRPAQPGSQPFSASKPQTPQSVGAPPVYVPPPAARKGNRALWMAAGAIACVCVLGAAIYTLPNLLRSPSAASKTDSGHGTAVVAPKDQATGTATTPAPIAPAVNPTAAVNPSPPEQQPAPPVLSASAGVKASNARRALPANPVVPASNSQEPALPHNPAGIQPTAPVSQPSAQPTVSQEEMDKASEDLMKLRARADAVRGSLNNLRAQQASQGVGLRPDIAAAASRMDSYLQAADSGLQSGRVDFARKNIDHANEEITKIEAFFGR